MALVQLVQTKPASYQLAGATALRFIEDLEEVEQRFEFIDKLLDHLAPAP
jgi:transcription-repair coupling factor (superfamily II helicase)